MPHEPDGIRDRRSLIFRRFQSLVESLEQLPGAHWFLTNVVRCDSLGRSLTLGCIRKKLETRKYNSKFDLADDVKFLFATSIGSGEDEDEDGELKQAAESCLQTFDVGFKRISASVTYGVAEAGNGIDKNMTSATKKRGPPFKKDRIAAAIAAATVSSQISATPLTSAPKPVTSSSSSSSGISSLRVTPSFSSSSSSGKSSMGKLCAKEAQRHANARKNAQEIKNRLGEELVSLLELREKVEVLRGANHGSVEMSTLNILSQLMNDMNSQHNVVSDLVSAEEARLTTKVKTDIQNTAVKTKELQGIHQKKESPSCVDDDQTINDVFDGLTEDELRRFPGKCFEVKLILNGEIVVRSENELDQSQNDEEDVEEEDVEDEEDVRMDEEDLNSSELMRSAPKTLKAILTMRHEPPPAPLVNEPPPAPLVNEPPPAPPSAPPRAMIPRRLLASMTIEEKQSSYNELLGEYLIECGAESYDPADWTVEIEMKKDASSTRTFNTVYFNKFGKQFRSRAEIARYLKLSRAPATKRSSDAASRRNKALLNAGQTVPESEQQEDLKGVAVLALLNFNNESEVPSSSTNYSSSPTSSMTTSEPQRPSFPPDVSLNRKAISELKLLQNMRNKLEKALIREREKREQVRYPIEDYLLEFEPPLEPPPPPRPEAEGHGYTYAKPSLDNSLLPTSEEVEALWCEEGRQVRHNKFGRGVVVAVSRPWVWVVFNNTKVMKKAKSKAVRFEALNEVKDDAEVEDGDIQEAEHYDDIDGDDDGGGLVDEDKESSTLALSAVASENLFAVCDFLNAIGRPNYCYTIGLQPWILKGHQKSDKPSPVDDGVNANANNGKGGGVIGGGVDIDTFFLSLMEKGKWSSNAHECILSLLFSLKYTDDAWLSDAVFESIRGNKQEAPQAGRHIIDHNEEDDDKEEEEEEEELDDGDERNHSHGRKKTKKLQHKEKITNKDDKDDGMAWLKTGSPYLGAAVKRTVYDSEDEGEGTKTELIDGVVTAWLPEDCSDYINPDSGEMVSLFRVEYCSGSLVGDGEDLEEEELWVSLPPTEVEKLKEAHSVAIHERSKNQEKVGSSLGKKRKGSLNGLEEEYREGKLSKKKTKPTTVTAEVSKRGRKKKTRHVDPSEPQHGKRWHDAASKFVPLNSISVQDLRNYSKPLPEEVTGGNWADLALALAIGILSLQQEQHQSQVVLSNTAKANFRKNKLQKQQDEEEQVRTEQEGIMNEHDKNADLLEIDREKDEEQSYDKYFSVDPDHTDHLNKSLLSKLKQLSCYDEASIEMRIFILYTLVIACNESDLVSAIYIEQLEERNTLESKWFYQDRKLKGIKKVDQIKKYVLARQRIAVRRRNGGNGSNYWNQLSDFDTESDQDDDDGGSDIEGDEKVENDDDESHDSNEMNDEKAVSEKRKNHEKSIPKKKKVKTQSEQEDATTKAGCLACQGKHRQHTCVEGGSEHRKQRRLEMKGVAPYFVQQELQKILEAEACGVSGREPFFVLGDNFIAKLCQAENDAMNPLIEEMEEAAPTDSRREVEPCINTSEENPDQDRKDASGQNDDVGDKEAECEVDLLQEEIEKTMKESEEAMAPMPASPVPVVLKGGLKIRPVKVRKEVVDDAIDETQIESNEMKDSAAADMNSPCQVLKSDIEQRRQTMQTMKEALDSGDVEELKVALKKGREVGFEGVISEEHLKLEADDAEVKQGLVLGAKWVSELQKDVYVALKTNSDVREERIKVGTRRIQSGQLTPGRLSPLGVDRFGRHYFSYHCDSIPLRVWIHKTPDSFVQSSRSEKTRPLDHHHGFGNTSMSWISTPDQITKLVDSLDKRGIKEKHLREALMCHLETQQYYAPVLSSQSAEK